MKKSLALLFTFFCFAAALMAQSQNKEEFYIKKVQFDPNLPLAEKVSIASRLIPSPQQYEWQNLELTAFIHFGVNTFTDREWGTGKEDPNIFNPSSLDTRQWARVLKEAGFRLIILTAKHHDGFCLWPTATTKHSVASSKWKGGKGDVVKELMEACKEYGLKFGLYLSPWDRNAKCYGDSPRYNDFFIRQLTELLTNYGKVDELWFDGANEEGPNGEKQIYDWQAFDKIIRKLQPDIVTSIMGGDIRWVGNEKGFGREMEWSANVISPAVYSDFEEHNAKVEAHLLFDDLGSRKMLKRTSKLFWFPSEVDVSIRPSWFYHESENSKVKSPEELFDIYLQSVGRNSVLLLNIPPDKRGLINEADEKALLGFARNRNKAFSENLVKDEHTVPFSLSGKDMCKVIDLKEKTEINTFMLQEDILQGQRVESFSVEALVFGFFWKTVAKGTTVGYKRILKFPTVKTNKIRINIHQARATVNISNVGAYCLI